MITFSRVVPGLYDPETGHSAEATATTITGEAIIVRGDPDRYRTLGLIESSAPTLFFTPTSYGLQAFTDEFVTPGDTVVLNDRTFVTKDVLPIAPDGLVIAARIVVSA